jgi:hypothetical protein
LMDGEMFKWSGGLRVQPLLDFCSAGSAKVTRQMACSGVDEKLQSFRVHVGVSQMIDSSGQLSFVPC